MLYIFDKDGTLIASLGKRPANTPAEQRPLPGVVEKLAGLRAAGHRLALASNQGGVAWGFLTPEKAEALMVDCAEKMGGLDAWRYSPYDSKAAARRPNSSYAREDESRKPRPGMLLSIMAELGVSAAETVMVGDQESDQQAAEAAGVQFAWAEAFFAPPNGQQQPSSAD
jgi:D-glycero-D-manno-heptose 1,7-bisphosphate phosphatase